MRCIKFDGLKFGRDEVRGKLFILREGLRVFSARGAVLFWVIFSVWVFVFGIMSSRNSVKGTRAAVRTVHGPASSQKR
jgi:hypothetical protein